MSYGASDYADAGDDEAITGINITPFVDVVLVLLVIFMLTAKLIVARGVDGIEQPTASSGTDLRASVRLSVSRSGELFVGTTAVASDVEAIEQIRAALAAAPSRKVLIRGDTATAYGGVMRAIDVARAAGADSVALENVKP